MISRQASLAYCSTSNEKDLTCFLLVQTVLSTFPLPYSLLCCWLSFMPADFGSHRLTNLSVSQSERERDGHVLTYRHVYISLSSRSRAGVEVEVEVEVDSVRRGIKSVAQSQSKRPKK